MLERGQGVIINVSSVHGFRATDSLAAFCAANAGVIMLTRSLGTEWARRGVRVVGVAPGTLLTGEIDADSGGADMISVFRQRTPMKRLGQPDEVVQAILYLASADASYILGETLSVDGGWLAYTSF